MWTSMPTNGLLIRKYAEEKRKPFGIRINAAVKPENLKDFPELAEYKPQLQSLARTGAICGFLPQ